MNMIHRFMGCIREYKKPTILTLSTCCRKYDKANSGNQRLVVMAKLLPEGATAQEFSVSLVDDPEMP